jgi:hypothetical protein
MPIVAYSGRMVKIKIDVLARTRNSFIT